MSAEIYTKNDCPYCVKSKALLAEKNISYNEYIISAGFNERKLLPNQQYTTKAELLEKLPTAKTVPQIWLDGKHIGGYTDLVKYFEVR
jgi:glutaredoxin 3